MEYRWLFILVEGGDDERFFNRVLKPMFERKYNWVQVVQYRGMKREKVDRFLGSIKSMKADYIYVVDIDEAPCVTAKKQEVKSRLKNIDEDRIVVVVKEIESWYLAGLTDEAARKLRIRRSFKATDDVTKELFNHLIPRRFSSRIDFMQEILERFSIEMAVSRNRSFKYLVEKFDC